MKIKLAEKIKLPKKLKLTKKIKLPKKSKPTKKVNLTKREKYLLVTSFVLIVSFLLGNYVIYPLIRDYQDLSGKLIEKRAELVQAKIQVKQLDKLKGKEAEAKAQLVETMNQFLNKEQLPLVLQEIQDAATVTGVFLNKAMPAAMGNKDTEGSERMDNNATRVVEEILKGNTGNLPQTPKNEENGSEEKADLKPYREEPFDIYLTGQYSQIINFLHQLEEKPWFLDYERVDLIGDPQSREQAMELDMTIYVSILN